MTSPHTRPFQVSFSHARSADNMRTRTPTPRTHLHPVFWRLTCVSQNLPQTTSYPCWSCMGQTPHTVFAQRLWKASLVSGSLFGTVPHGTQGYYDTLTPVQESTTWVGSGSFCTSLLRFELCASGNLACLQVAPQGDEKLARQRHDSDSACSFAMTELLAEPQCQFAVGLVT
jgi:hypothetical protein